MRSFRHWTPFYVRDRLLLKAHEWRHPADPWIGRSTVAFLRMWLRKTDCGLEWGSGRSTLWFGHHVGHLLSVEHDPVWAERVRTMLREAGLTERVDYRLCEAGPGSTPGTMPSYLRVADELAPESLDFCLVDGALREQCARAAIAKLKPGGLLIVDNIERYFPREPKSRAPNARSPADGFANAGWRDFADNVSSWRCLWTSDGVTDTACWIKPARPSEPRDQDFVRSAMPAAR
jgi:predicted O-methyltransferase YrrM